MHRRVHKADGCRWCSCNVQCTLCLKNTRHLAGMKCESSFNNFLSKRIPEKRSAYTLRDCHLTWDVLLHYLVKFANANCQRFAHQSQHTVALFQLIKKIIAKMFIFIHFYICHFCRNTAAATFYYLGLSVCEVFSRFAETRFAEIRV